MSGPSTAREALLAELIGDIQRMLDQLADVQKGLASADESARATAEALQKANVEFRAQVDDTLARMRVELAALLSKTAERTVSDLAGRQTETLMKAAAIAIRQTMSAEMVRRARRDWLVLAAAAAGVGAMSALGATAAIRWLLTFAA